MRSESEIRKTSGGECRLIYLLLTDNETVSVSVGLGASMCGTQCRLVGTAMKWDNSDERPYI